MLSMPPDDSFADLARRVRAGDSAAIARLIRSYETELKRFVRLRLDHRLRPRLDTADVCQSVFAAFFVRLSVGQIELRGPQDLAKLLVTMARNKLIDWTRKPAVRDVILSSSRAFLRLADKNDTPATAAWYAELMREIPARLGPAERSISDGRRNGRSWTDLSAALGRSPDALRKQPARA